MKWVIMPLRDLSHLSLDMEVPLTFKRDTYFIHYSRNLSSAGLDGRQAMRSCYGLVDSLLFVLRCVQVLWKSWYLYNVKISLFDRHDIFSVTNASRLRAWIRYHVHITHRYQIEWCSSMRLIDSELSCLTKSYVVFVHGIRLQTDLLACCPSKKNRATSFLDFCQP